MNSNIVGVFASVALAAAAVSGEEIRPGAQGQKHTTIEGAGHFLQEQKGEELARVIVQFIEDNPLP